MASRKFHHLCTCACLWLQYNERNLQLFLDLPLKSLSDVFLELNFPAEVGPHHHLSFEGQPLVLQAMVPRVVCLFCHISTQYKFISTGIKSTSYTGSMIFFCTVTFVQLICVHFFFFSLWHRFAKTSKNSRKFFPAVQSSRSALRSLSNKSHLFRYGLVRLIIVYPQLGLNW